MIKINLLRARRSKMTNKAPAALLLATAIIGILLSALAAQAQDSTNEISTTWPATSQRTEKTWKVQIAPISTLVNSLYVGANTRIGRSAWSLGGEIERTNFDVTLYHVKRSGVAITPTYHFSGNPFRDSWYWSPRLAYRWGTVGQDLAIIAYEGDFKMAGTEQYLGYQWHWDNFNMGLALGVAAYSIEVSNVKGKVRLFGMNEYSSDGGSATDTVAVATGEFMMGWSF